jgi:uncharacterized protein
MNSKEMDLLMAKVKDYVSEYMSQFDPSHDYQHIERVLALAQEIEAKESIQNHSVSYRSDLVTLAALLHDIGDKKYISPGQDGATMAAVLLLDLGCPEELAQQVQVVVNHVSWSAEQKDPSRVQRTLVVYPELAIVQDADRLDAIGAVGIARCFAYSGAIRRPLGQAVEHFHEKLLNIRLTMKTETGRDIAVERSRRLSEFVGWWEEETGTITGPAESDSNGVQR